MSLRAGNYHCDGCGLQLENGGVHECAVITTVQRHDPSQVRQYHLCRAPRDGAPHGCEGRYLGPRGALANFNETRNPA